ncbi:hypothetical protein ACFE04_016536 [Oxalis oulophora]
MEVVFYLAHLTEKVVHNHDGGADERTDNVVHDDRICILKFSQAKFKLEPSDPTICSLQSPLFKPEFYILQGCFSQWVHSCFLFVVDPDFLENIHEKQDLDALGALSDVRWVHYIPWATLNFEEGTVGTDVTITRNNGTMHDASFTTNSKYGFTDIVSEWNPTPSEHVGTT